MRVKVNSRILRYESCNIMAFFLAETEVRKSAGLLKCTSGVKLQKHLKTKEGRANYPFHIQLLELEHTPLLVLSGGLLYEFQPHAADGPYQLRNKRTITINEYIDFSYISDNYICTLFLLRIFFLCMITGFIGFSF